MDVSVFANLWLGLQTAGSFINLFYCLIGVFLGTAIGVLPGLGPVATIAMLLPITFGLPPVTSLIMLAGIFYGAQYGGSTTAILINLPGESSSIVTALDGYEMAKAGKAGKALATAAWASFFAGTVTTILIALFSPPLAEVALKFGPAEYFSLMVLGLVASVVLAHGSLMHALGMIVLGLLLGIVGTDVNSGVARYSFDLPELIDGINFVVVAMGVFGLGEIICNLETETERSLLVKKVSGLMLDRNDFKAIAAPVLRGHLSRLDPWGSCPAAARCSHRLPLTQSKRKCRRTRPISARARSKASLRRNRPTTRARRRRSSPMLTLGIPSNPVMALMIGAMIIQGIQPGPSVMVEQPALFWGLVASMWIGNVMLVILNLPLIGLWGQDGVGAVSPAVPGDPGVLLHRRVQPVQYGVRHLLHGDLRLGRLYLPQGSNASRRRCCSASSWAR